MTVIIILSSLGGIVAFVGGVVVLVRAIFRSVNAIGENTRAMVKVDKTLAGLTHTVSQHTIDIAILQDRSRRRLCLTK